MIRAPRSFALALVGLLLFAFIYTQQQDRFPSITSTSKQASSSSSSAAAAAAASKQFSTSPPAGSSKDVQNSTLGFEKVFVINLPERFDKLDAFSLAASVTGFTHGVVAGVKGTDVVNKTLPSLDGLPKTERARNNIVGCWRAHLNFAQKIVTDRISTALVLEDDADWDVSFKNQLADFATGARYISGTSSTPRSPYGDDWDLLWLGHCSAQQIDSDKRHFVIRNDPTVPPPAHRVNFNAVPDLTKMGYDNSTRIVFRANNGVCLYSYALSFRGARKVLRWQAKVKKFEPIDIGVGHHCRDDPDFKCIAVFPQLIDTHKGPGRKSRDSDIGAFKATDIREKGFTPNIMQSTRLNIDNLIKGEDAQIEQQWPEDVPQLTAEKRTQIV
ncbi:MAG: hypothetical protein Q9167_005747 [Letrouitia subvulpina]